MENTNLNNEKLNNINQRDYDKEPLILRDYSKEITFHSILNLVFFLISSLFVFAIQKHIEFGEFDELVKKSFYFIVDICRFFNYFL